MSNRNRNRSDTCKIPFHTIIAGSFVAGAAVVQGNPLGLSNNGRLLAEADAWAHFRILQLKFRLHPPDAAPTSRQAAGWAGGAQDTTPATVTNIMELLPATVISLRNTKPTDWVNVPTVDTSGPLPWYKSIQGTADVTEEYPGVIALAGAGTDGYVLEIRGKLEFKVSISTANTPAEVALRAKLRQERVALEKEAAQRRVLALLGVTPGQQVVSLGGSKPPL